MRRLLPVVLLLTAWLSRPSPAWACSCILPDAPAVVFGQTDAVFAGRVTRVVDPWQNPLLAHLMTYVPALAARFSDVPVTFRVDESWKGVTTTTVTLQNGSGLCSLPFALWGQYVVYADQVGDRLSTTACSRTNFAAQATEDLTYLQTLPRLTLTPTPSSRVPLVWLGMAALGGLTIAVIAWQVRRDSATGKNRQ